MKQWKTWQIALFVLLCVMLNYGGRVLATRLSLPLWMDSFGTVLCAYAGGPLCGAIVGVSVNALCCITLGTHCAYALTSIALGMLVGFAARKGMLKSLFGTLSVSAIVALLSLFISVPLNLILFGGSTSNVWGDGVIGFLTERHIPPVVCAIAGEFYLEFLDKTLTLMALYLLIKLIRRVRGSRAGAAEKATLSVLATPEDDLSLAAALRSPLFGLTEDDLFRLAQGRGRRTDRLERTARLGDGGRDVCRAAEAPLRRPAQGAARLRGGCRARGDARPGDGQADRAL